VKNFKIKLFLAVVSGGVYFCSANATLAADVSEPLADVLVTETQVATDSEKQKDLEPETKSVKPLDETTGVTEGTSSPIESSSSIPLPVPVEPTIPSEENVRQAWEASSQGDLKRLEEIIAKAEKLFGERARKEETSLTNFPERGKEKDYQSLNDFGTILFVQAEALMNYGKTEEAVVAFQKIIDNFKWAQAWDPSRGNFWSVAGKSQASIDVMTGKVEEETEIVPQGKRVLPQLAFPGKKKIVDYLRYGEFIGVGTAEYRYQINDPAGLSEAVGEGIYPNTSDILKDPRYLKAREDGRLEGNHWDFVYSDDLEAAFYKWANAPEPGGTKLFYMGMIFEKAGMYYEALKTYHSLVIHFPHTVGWTYWQTPWYPAQAAIAKINHIVRTHPELNLKVQWMKIEVKNGFDNDVSNDVVITYPGVIQEKNLWDRFKERFNVEKTTVKLEKIKRVLGRGEVQLVQYDNGHWQMVVRGEPYIIKGITYSPTKIGQSPDKNTLVSWMYEDNNKNGLPDGPYDSWIDSNRNNVQDADEPIVGDFKLLSELGVNTIREYHHAIRTNKELLRRLYKDYGIRVMMGNYLGKYTFGSGATWFEGTDYENPEHQQNMLESVRQMVMEHKDEPYILLWLLGNENNYGVASNADQKPEAYFRFVNEVAKLIKSIDPNHPVALCNGDILYLDMYAKYAPDVDIFAANVYRGDYGFGAFWEQVKDATDKPTFITEYGCPAYARHMSLLEGEEAQAEYHKGNWLDIEANLAGQVNGAGNALGGVVFEWMDEWWKNYEPFYHDRNSEAIGPFPGGYYYEEWFGIISQGKGTNSPFLRQLRKSYDFYKERWNALQPALRQ
jgi:hypothetical protein